MPMLLSLAVRNVTRNRARTALTLAAIGFGVLMTVFLGGFAKGFQNLMTDDTVLAKTGALEVHKKGFFDSVDSQPLDFDIPQDASFSRRIASVPGVRAVTPRLEFSGLVNNGSSSTLFIATAIDAKTVYQVLPNLKDDLTGRPINENSPNGAVLGKDLAESLGVEAGGTLVLQAARKGGQQNALDVDVIGHVASFIPFEAKRFAYVPLSFAQELLGMEGRVTEYVIAVNDRDAIPSIAQAVQTAVGPDYEVETWQQLKPDMAARVRFIQLALSVICFVFLIIAVIGVVNTMLMSVMERTREIGTMLAVGVRRSQVTLLFLFEALVLAVMGATLGALAGTVIVNAIAGRGGLTVTPPGASIAKQILPVAPPMLLIIAVGASVVGALAAGAYPAWRASRLRPVEALRAV